jgi:6-phosphofructokinase
LNPCLGCGLSLFCSIVDMWTHCAACDRRFFIPIVDLLKLDPAGIGNYGCPLVVKGEDEVRDRKAVMTGTNPDSKDRPKVGLVVGGGPAPGVNGVISAATITAIENGCDVVGILDGFKWLEQGDTQHIRSLTISDVSRIHLRGGSIIRTSRSNPTKSTEKLDNVVNALTSIGIKYLISIGGDDTAYTAYRVTEQAAGRLKTAHVPKTIDNDLPLPDSTPTFGYTTARHLGVTVVKNLSEDARTTLRWYLVVAMGRTAGHLALGIGKAAGATLTVVPEEFGDRRVTIKEICDIVEGAILKRLSMGREFGVAILAEGLAASIREDELAQYGTVEHDEHGHVRLSEISLGHVCKDAVRNSLSARGIKVTIVNKDLGYELRCADPGPHDMEYTRDLGYGAIKFLLNGGSGALISIQGGSLAPIPFEDIIDPETKRTRVRRVDINSESYEVAHMYMLRLKARDFEDPRKLESLAAVSKMSGEEFKQRFAYLWTGPKSGLQS